MSERLTKAERSAIRAACTAGPGYNSIKAIYRLIDDLDAADEREAAAVAAQREKDAEICSQLAHLQARSLVRDQLLFAAERIRSGK